MSSVTQILFGGGSVIGQTVEVAELAERIELMNLGNIVTALVIIAVAFVGNRVISATLDKLGEGQARRRLLMKKVQSFVRLAIVAITAYLVVATFVDFQEDRAALLGLGGTLALAVGFALKDTASSVMAGIMILVDQPFQVGDRVSFGNHYGEVKEIGLRSVRIVTLDDNLVSIPNNKFLTEAVASANAGALHMMVDIDIFIDMSADFDQAKAIVYEACITSRYVYLKRPVVILVSDEMTPNGFATRIRCKAYVIDTRYEKALLSDVMERVKAAFRREEIHYPYRRNLTVGETRSQAEGWSDVGGTTRPIGSTEPVARSKNAGAPAKDAGAQEAVVGEG